MAKKASPPALAEGLARVRSLADEMNSATDELNNSFREIESIIANLNLGVTASVQIDGDEFSTWVACLSFAKEQQAWRLLYESGEDEESWKAVPLVNASRAVRLMAVDHLEELVQELIKTAANEVEKVRAKTQTVKDLSATLQAVNQTGGEDIPF
jgi:prefoldin subunit 5